jgi:hypothetical protein
MCQNCETFVCLQHVIPLCEECVCAWNRNKWLILRRLLKICILPSVKVILQCLVEPWGHDSRLLLCGRDVSRKFDFLGCRPLVGYFYRGEEGERALWVSCEMTCSWWAYLQQDSRGGDLESGAAGPPAEVGVLSLYTLCGRRVTVESRKGLFRPGILIKKLFCLRCWLACSVLAQRRDCICVNMFF